MGSQDRDKKCKQHVRWKTQRKDATWDTKVHANR